MKFLFSLPVFALIILNACRRNEFPGTPAKKYSSAVAMEWMKLNMRLTKSTPGFNSVVAGRSFGYAGLTLYESIVPGINGAQSVMLQLNTSNSIPNLPKSKNTAYYWPASANAAMAHITRSIFSNVSPANLVSIDSLETAFNQQFASQAGPGELKVSSDFGKAVAAAIFDWSKTDGGHEGHLKVTIPGYIPPVGPGLWISTPPANSPPIHPYWGNNRTFAPNIAITSQPAAPVAYSGDPGSEFHTMVNELYTISQSLSAADTTTIRFWGDLPVNYNVPAHATGILNQLISKEQFKLDDAAIAYAKHGMAMSDALISVLRAKYNYNLVRPISYIRNVMGHSAWNSVIPTPPHPEYPAAHGVVSSASATVLEKIFGKQYSFTDHTYDSQYGSRSFSSFEAYAYEAAYSRVIGGIHYKPSIITGLAQGKLVGEAINKINFRKSGH